MQGQNRFDRSFRFRDTGGLLRIRLLGILLSAIIGVTATPALTAQGDPAGTWNGSIEVPGSPLAIELTLRTEGPGWSGRYSIPVQNLHDVPLEAIEVSGMSVAFALGGNIPGSPAFRLELNEEGDRMTGTFTQGGATLPASFTRAGSDKPTADPPASLDDIRDDLQNYVDSVRSLWKVPGLAVAIVRGEEELTIVSGLRDVEGDKGVTPRTQFAIGSTTKAFTATLIGTLVDEGLLDWDDLVIEHLPQFALHDTEAARRLRIRDLLTHTSGLPRHDILWYLGADLSRDDLLGRLPYLEPTAQPNQKWQYQNLMYLVAGMVAERVTGRTWEDLVTERILRPLDMADGSTLDVTALAAAADHATGYAEEEGEFREVPFRRLNSIAPAGAINSSADAITGWLRMNVDGGEAEGVRVIEEGTLRTIHSPQVVMPGTTAFRGKMYALYGYGWMISAYRGENLVYHGGAIDGFVAHISLLPEKEIGVAVMANRSTILPEVASLDIIDMVRGEESFDHAVRLAQNMEEFAPDPEEDSEEVDRIEGTSPSRPLDAFTGRYAHPAYDTVSVTLEGGTLRLDYFGNRVRLDHFHYDVFTADTSSKEFSGLRVMFVPEADGSIESLAVPMESALPPIEFERLPDSRLSDPVYLRRYAGSWTIAGQNFTVTERAGTLLVDLPGQTRFTLEPEGIAPDGSATFSIDGLTGFRVRFTEEDGELVALFLQPNGTFRASKTE